MVTIGLDGQPWDPREGACECSICAFMVEHDIVDGYIPAELMDAFGAVQAAEVVRSGQRFGMAQA